MKDQDRYAILTVFVVAGGIFAFSLPVAFGWNDPSSYYGSLAGSFFGLLALLAGALVNAQLNRRRDSELLNEQLLGLLKAIKFEVVESRQLLMRQTNTMRLLQNTVSDTEWYNLLDNALDLARIDSLWMRSEGALQLMGRIQDDELATALHRYARLLSESRRTFGFVVTEFRQSPMSAANKRSYLENFVPTYVLMINRTISQCGTVIEAINREIAERAKH